jgi:uncharacterized protein (TIGR02588 family)
VSGPAGASEGQARADATRGPRRFAEWLTFGVSLTLVLAVVFYLLWRLREPATDALLAQVTPELDHVTEQGGRFVLPIRVKNPGSRTVRDLKVRVEYRELGEARSVDVLIGYVGQSAEQLVYVYMNQNPRLSSVHAEAVSYLVD